MSDRKRAIETLKQLRLDYEEFYEEHNNEVTQAYDMAISSLETDEAYQLEYESTSKNDLGVDWDELKRKILMEVDGGTDDAWLAYGEVCNRISNSINEYVQNIKAMPPVTPIRPKGHWIPIYQGDEIIDYRCSECEFGNTFGKGTFGMNFCTRCGSDNREVKE